MRLAIMAACVAAPAAAQECRFDVECFDTEACVSSEGLAEGVGGWTVTLDGDVLSTDFGDLSVVARPGEAVVAEGEGMVVLLTPDAEGARASVHMDGAMVSYAGACGPLGEAG